ncbi:acyltransferase family protein [Nocardia huaxiensis]|uniref:acyltransferase family protein n=1 Tax=Nocardia huaxiensis TaxID=2755382 RepID=UPI001E5262D0|nr:acyltransferase family protein [Nocardia huaxiensis]UFS97040.1 acyltransferase [Nocardia huaxiensis]
MRTRLHRQHLRIGGAETPNPVPSSTIGRDHREDLDGLRGLAIALVVGFHVWMGRVSGGVDVFLVLSGFFFTGMLLRRTGTTGAVGIGATLRRTGRRLFPALWIVLATVTAATIALRPYTQWSDVSAQLLASGFYFQNWYLATAEMDYAAPDPSISALQHLWSMAVQVQFYLVILAVIALWARVRPQSNRDRAGLLGFLIAGGLISFYYAATGSAQHQAWTYYDSAARLWELLAGAALAVALPWISIPARIRWIAAFFGLGMVLSCGLLIDGASEFPGPAALFPVIATLLLILSGLPGETPARPWPNRVLSGRSCTELGAIAYPLYLWHWPILIFYLAETGHARAGFTGGLMVIVISVVLAKATTHLIEAPLRRRSAAEIPTTSRYRRGVGILVTAVGVSVLASALGWQLVTRTHPARPPEALKPNRYPGAAALLDGIEPASEPLRPSVFEGNADAPPPTFDGCITPTREVRSCTYGDTTAARSIAVVGGSHSEHWIPALEILSREYGFRIVTFLKEGCPLVLVDEPSYAESPFPECREWTLEVLDRLAQDRPDWVFTISTRYRLHGEGDEVPPEYLDVWSALSDRGLNVLALRDTPRLRHEGVLYRAVDCLAQHGTADSCGIDRAKALDAVDPAADPAAAFPNVFPMDLTDAVCRPDRCRVAEGNVLIYRDEHHLTASYARSLAPELGRQIAAITRWW